MSAREPHVDRWRQEAFKLQQIFWADKSTVQYNTQSRLTESLKRELQSIRDSYRDMIKQAETLVSQLKAENVDSELRHQFSRVMEKISLNCSDDMVQFATRVIGESVSLLNMQPPCEFEAVAIGSIARGEATPYSDLEYLFLVDSDKKEAIQYFEDLAITNYFLIGNLGETKLSYMNVKQLGGWFSDAAKNGFKIDGLAAGAGNIPTGSKPQNRNHFIVTPEQLADRYKYILDNPDPSEALRGDLTSMLTYTRSLYLHRNHNKQNQNKQMSLLQRFNDLISPLVPNQDRKNMNMKMLNTDAKKFKFIPDHNLSIKGFNADVKKELYRFPSIILLDICIVSGCVSKTSWESLVNLLHKEKISQDLFESLQFLLAAASYIRLSAYLKHDSHDDRMSVAEKMTRKVNTQVKIQHVKSSQRWFIPCDLFSIICASMIPLKEYMANESLRTQDLMSFSSQSDSWWSHVTTLYYSGNYSRALSALKLKYEGLCDTPVESALQLASVLPHSSSKDTLDIVSGVLYMCSEYKPALQLYQYMTDNDIGNKYSQVADCHIRLGNYLKAIQMLTRKGEKSHGDYFSLGWAYMRLGNYKAAEISLIQALQIAYNNTSAEVLTDYYGNPLTTDANTENETVDLIGAPSPEQRLRMIHNISPEVISYLLGLGAVYRNQMHYSIAEEYYMRCLQFKYELYGEGAAVQSVAQTLNNLGVTYDNMGEYNKTIQCNKDS